MEEERKEWGPEFLFWVLPLPPPFYPSRRRLHQNRSNLPHHPFFDQKAPSKAASVCAEIREFWERAARGSREEEKGRRQTFPPSTVLFWILLSPASYSSSPPVPLPRRRLNKNKITLAVFLPFFLLLFFLVVALLPDFLEQNSPKISNPQDSST